MITTLHPQNGNDAASQSPLLTHTPNAAAYPSPRVRGKWVIDGSGRLALTWQIADNHRRPSTSAAPITVSQAA